MKKILLLLAVAAVFVSCGHRGGRVVETYRPFPFVEVPSLITDSTERMEYSVEHYWDAFFAADGVTDTSAVLGVRTEDVEYGLSTYLGLVSMMPKEEGQKAVGSLFGMIERKQAADTSGHVYLLMTDLVSKYLYDPNSPLRDEDLYLPFVHGLAGSRFTNDDVRPGYVFEEKMCSLNRYGTVATDFLFKDAGGRTYSLHGVKADHTVLFFSNPGCESCSMFALSLMGSERLDSLIDGGRVKVVNIYIDRELDKWRGYVKNYPSSWLSGYDFRNVIRDEAIYNVRAIPSLYLLDAEKRVMMKDVPPERLLDAIEKLN